MFSMFGQPSEIKEDTTVDVLLEKLESYKTDATVTEFHFGDVIITDDYYMPDAVYLKVDELLNSNTNITSMSFCVNCTQGNDGRTLSVRTEGNVIYAKLFREGNLTAAEQEDADASITETSYDRSNLTNKSSCTPTG